MSPKQVAITGAGRGIGRAIAEAFLQAGWKVWALVRTEASVAELRSRGLLEVIPFDASSDASVMEACRQLGEKAGALDTLINNAGVAFSAPITKTSTEELDRLMRVNVTTPFVLCRELTPAMAKAGGGRIVNITSTASKKGLKYTAAYVASKHALLGLTRAMAVELAGKNITVNAVSPGWTETDMLTDTTTRITATTGRTQEDARSTLSAMNALKRIIRPEEVAELVLFLASAKAGASITGADFAIDGGEQ